MSNRYDTAQQFWCASATTAAVCFLTPRPLKALVPLGIGYFVYRLSRHGFPWGECEAGSEGCVWEDLEEYHASSGDRVDDILDDSFPASDPPSFSPGTAAPVKS